MARSRGHVKIVVPCTNEGEWLRVTVDSLLEHTHYPSFEVFVIANADTITDFSFVEREAYRSRVRLRVTGEQLGVGRSINAAVWPGDAKYYVFLDAHSLVEQHDWLERVVDCLEAYPGASMFQPEVVQFSYAPAVEGGGSLDLNAVQPLFRAYSIRWQWPYQSMNHIADVQTFPDSDEPYEAMAGGGMAVFVRSELFHDLGKHDQEVGGWHPKTRDYCLRGWFLGHPMMVLPSVRVYHREKSGNRAYPQRSLDAVHGILRTVYRYFSPRRRALAEVLLRRQGLHGEVDEAIRRIHAGDWLRERARILRERVHDDDWLFKRFDVHEERLSWPQASR